MERITYVGLDVHKSLVVATALDPMGNRINQRKFGPTDSELIEYLTGLPGENTSHLRRRRSGNTTTTPQRPPRPPWYSRTH